MSDPLLDALAETARNRGLKLVRSRVRTPGKRRFGKVGLTDAKGEPVFGMDAKGPTGKPEDVEAYLRNLGARDWGASLDVPVKPRKKPKPRRAPATDRTVATDAAPGGESLPEPAPPPKRKPPPKPEIRTAKPADTTRITELLQELGYDTPDAAVRKNLKTLKKAGEMPLVATLAGEIVGLCGVSARVTVARPAPVGRITSLVVTQAAQGKGIGRLLVEAAEAWMRKAGCEIVEVTSNDRRAEAHAFYRHMGYDRSSIRFVKTL